MVASAEIDAPIQIETLPGQRMTVPDAVKQALDYCNAGWLDISTDICGRILAADPGNAHALLIRGIATYKDRDPASAVAILSDALRRDPSSSDAMYHLGMALLLSGQFDRAGLAFTCAMQARSDYAEAMAGLAEVHRAKGDADGAFALLQRSVALKGNYSPSYITYSLMRFDRSLPPEEEGWNRRREARRDRPRLTMASLGSYGRFAQTVNEYVAVRLYAEKYGMEFLTPDWVGHAFFSLDDPRLDPSVLPEFQGWLRQRKDFARGFDERVDDPFRDRDLFLGGSPVNAMLKERRADILSWLTPRPCWNRFLEPPVEALRRRGRTLVAVHIRQTDWWNQDYTPLSLYLDWLDGLWPTLEDPVLFVATDEPSVVPEFARFNPTTPADFPVRWEGLEYLQDFHVMTRADILAISTGFFAATAAALNPSPRLLLHPAEGNRGLQPFEVWR
ncbi:tetratricopeptide repeat protein [Azospirillum sp. B21]|uniref:tetratricopeptide repeat protein n=1 Tax=Azospirillum sp. B21 TaxID=2607496 RepID=UPI0011EF91EE|nr:tetratricopeptide repeat protein [Azospirillum sp. B21]KAA0577896.1 tetratricopeptide repeat protein [Azospirillum sp. B21]